MWYLVLTSIIWAFSFGLIKSQLSGLDPYVVALLRLALSLIVFMPFLGRTPMKLKWLLFGVGAIQFGAMYCLYIRSYAYLQAHEVALLTITTPVYVVFLDAVIQKSWRNRFWLAAVLAVAGAAVLNADLSRLGSPALKGLLLLQAANFCFALGQLLYKRVRQIPGCGRDLKHFAWVYLGGVSVPLTLVLWEGAGRIAWPDQANQWWTLLYLGLIPSGLGFFLWNRGITKVNNGVVAAMNNLKIPLGALLAWLVFQETINPFPALTSLALMGLAVFICERK